MTFFIYFAPEIRWWIALNWINVMDEILYQIYFSFSKIYANFGPNFTQLTTGSKTKFLLSLPTHILHNIAFFYDIDHFTLLVI